MNSNNNKYVTITFTYLYLLIKGSSIKYTHGIKMSPHKARTYVFSIAIFLNIISNSSLPNGL